MRRFKGLGVVLLVASCGQETALECAQSSDCPMGQGCVLQAADAERGVCVEPGPGLPAPGWGANVDLVPGRGCFPNCVRDMDPDTPALDPLCDVVRLDFANDSESTIPACAEEGGAPVIPHGAPACFILRANEALDPVCAAEGYNLDIEIVTAESEPDSVRYQAGCMLSPNTVKDCPLL